MLKTLSRTERVSVGCYDRQVQSGDIDSTPLWADDFSMYIYSHVPKGECVIDVGCGTGRFIQLLPIFGITNYFGIDPSQNSIQYCQKNFPEHSFAVQEIRTVGEEYPNQFSGFILTTTLMHIPHSDLGAAVKSLRECLKQGAHGMVSTPMPIEGDGKVWRNSAGMALSLYTPTEIQKVFSENGFSIQYIFTPDNHMLLAHMVAR